MRMMILSKEEDVEDWGITDESYDIFDDVDWD